MEAVLTGMESSALRVVESCTPGHWVRIAVFVSPGFRRFVYLASAGAAVALATGTLVYVGRAASSLLNSRRLRGRRNRKRQQCQSALEQLAADLRQSTLSDSERAAILALSLGDLVGKLQRRELTALHVLEAYQHAALAAHERTNCLIEPILEAKAHAEALDALETVKGPLHGVPVSIKDSYAIQNYESTLGCSGRIGITEPEDAVMVQVLKEAGAIPFVKTNIPQTMMSVDTSNPIFGQTTQPLDGRRTAGGSSGGEAALIACGGSVLGIGSDIGGSIRIPSHFCGTTGLKCTSDRLSSKGMGSCIQGQILMKTALGPMARDVDSLVLAMQALIGTDMFSRDSSIPPVPFNEQLTSGKGKLRIGVYAHDAVFTISEPCVRAMRVATEALRDLGHEIIAIDMLETSFDAVRLHVTTAWGDGAKRLLLSMKDDEISESMKPVYQVVSRPTFLKKTISWICSVRQWWPGFALVNTAAQGLGSVDNWWHHCVDVQEFRQRISEKWKELKLDAVIAPFSLPAMPCGDPMQAGGMLSPVTMYNILDFPAGTLPVTKVTQQDEDASVSFPRKDPWHYTGKKTLSDMVGLPVGVQVVSLPWQEEMVLRVMKDLETSVRKTNPEL